MIPKPSMEERPSTEPTVRNFDQYPALTDLLDEGGGIPGFYYAQVLAESVAEAQQRGWRMVKGVDAYFVRGVPMLLMCRGKRLSGISPQAGIRECYVQRTADARIKPRTEKAKSQ